MFGLVNYFYLHGHFWRKLIGGSNIIPFFPLRQLSRHKLRQMHFELGVPQWDYPTQSKSPYNPTEMLRRGRKCLYRFDRVWDSTFGRLHSISRSWSGRTIGCLMPPP